jgi:hypothetical protein
MFCFTLYLSKIAVYPPSGNTDADFYTM